MFRTTRSFLIARGLPACALLGALFLSACGHGRQVQRTQYGGVIALEGDRVKAMEDAHRQMAAQCGPGNYTILREGEVEIGQDQVARSDTYYDKDKDTQVNTASTRNATEWRVEYQCGGAPAQPPPPPQPQPYPPQGGPPGAPPPPPPGY